MATVLNQNMSKVIDGFKRAIDRLQTEVISDNFIKWLFRANSGMFEKGNLWCFDYAISHLPSSSPIVEIGPFCGLSTNLISYFKLKHGVENKLFCSDAWDFEGADKKEFLGEHPYLKHSDYKEFVKDSFVRNVKFFSARDLPYAIELLSDDFFAEWIYGSELTDLFGRSIRLGGSISFAFIDGNHNYDFVRRDFYNVDRLLEIGGFVLFDDSADGTQWEVKQIVADVIASERYELVKKNPNYFFKKLKHL